LISARHSADELAEIIGADSLGFMSVSGLTRGILGVCDQSSEFRRGKNCGLCMACFNGNYPTYLYARLESANKEVK